MRDSRRYASRPQEDGTSRIWAFRPNTGFLNFDAWLTGEVECELWAEPLVSDATIDLIRRGRVEAEGEATQQSSLQ